MTILLFVSHTYHWQLLEGKMYRIHMNSSFVWEDNLSEFIKLIQ